MKDYLFAKIYSYLTRGDPDYECNDGENINKYGMVYEGKREDKEWWDNDIYYKKQSNGKIHYKLVKNIGIFKCNSTHEITKKQHHGLMHLKPKYANVKEEVLYNSYCQLSKDNWNQTFRKSNVFEKMFAMQRSETSRAGTYYVTFHHMFLSISRVEHIIVCEMDRTLNIFE